MVAAADILIDLASEPERLDPSVIQGGSEVVEELLEIQLTDAVSAELGRQISMTMRTPGDDAALALGFLHADGVVRRVEDVEWVRHRGPAAREDGTTNVIQVQLRRPATVGLQRRAPSGPSVSTFGKGSKTLLETVRSNDPPIIGRGPLVQSSIVHTMPRRLRRHPAVVDRFGVMYAAALFQADGRLLRVRDDASRDNAVDKLIGAEFMAGSLPRSNDILYVSSRASFDIVQKALMAGIPVIVSVGAPSSFATTLAREHGMTLLAFVRDGEFQVHSGAARVSPVDEPSPVALARVRAL
jgi:FdhD protein